MRLTRAGKHPAATMAHHIATPHSMSAKPLYGIQTAFIVIACTALASCSSLSNMTSGMGSSGMNPINWVTPYRIDVIQGNFVSSEQVAQLRAGMSRDQVKATLGTPLMASLFHADRWDYVFTLKRQGIEPQMYKYTVFFNGDSLVKFEGDAMPSETEFIAKLDNKREFDKAPPLQATEEQLNKAAEKSTPKVAPAMPTPPAAAPTTVYPPLESPSR